VLAAVEEIATRRDVRLLIAGSGPLEETLRTRIGHGPLEKAVRFLGYITGTELRAGYECADAFVLPTTHGEGFPSRGAGRAPKWRPDRLHGDSWIGRLSARRRVRVLREPNRSDAIVVALETLFASADTRSAIRRSNLKLSWSMNSHVRRRSRSMWTPSAPSAARTRRAL
jgi:glycosyltransferase involved in cell wall biosynthesis